jgi:hypothetical protein
MTNRMTTRLRAIASALAGNLNPAESGVHFHAGPAGPYVCDYPRCVSPGLDPERLS